MISYWCFISYRHLDNIGEGREWATWLHQGLETFRVPPDLVGKRNNRGEIIPERIFPVFRDEEELPGGDLVENIREALVAARSLVVICSPRTPKSTYVAEEIRFYQELRARELNDGVEPQRAEPLLAIIDGDPLVPDGDTSCIPGVLRVRVDHDGKVTDQAAPETLWTDFRLPDNSPGWTSPTPYRAWLESNTQLSDIEVEEHVQAYSERIETARLRIIAGILGVTLGEIQKRQESYRLAEARRKLFESSFLLSTQAAGTSQAIAWLWRARHALDDDDPRVDLVHAISQNVAERLPEALVHDQRVTAAVFTPDGTEVVTASDDGFVRFWETATGTPITSIQAHPAGVTMACVSPDGAFALAGSERGQVCVFDIASHSLVHTVEVGEESITELEFDAQGERFLAQSGCLNDSTISVFSVRSGELVYRFDVMEEVFPTSAVALSPEGNHILMGAFYGGLILLDIRPGSPFDPLPGAGPTIERVGFNGKGDYFYMRKGKCVQVWEAKGPKLVAELEHEAQVLTAAFAPNGATIATGGRDGAVWIWSTTKGERTAGPFRHTGSVSSLRFDHKGKMLVTCSDDQLVRVWSLPDGELLKSIADDWQIRSAEIDRSGDYIVSTSNGASARLWRREPSSPPSPRGSMRHRGFVIRASYSPDGTTILTSSADGTSRLWAADTLKPRTSPLVQAHDDIMPTPSVVRAVFSPDGNLVATGSQGAIDVWDASTGERTIDTIRHRFELWALQFSPDSKVLLSSGRDGTVHLWNVSTSEPAMEPLISDGPRAGNTVFDAKFSPDGAYLAAGIETRKAVVWRLGDVPALVAEIPHGGPVGCVAFSPDGSKLATASSDGYARIFDPRTAEPLSDRLTHGAAARLAAFSPDGRLLLTGSDDHSVRVWDAITGSPIRPPIRHSGRIRALCFRHDGTMFATGDGKGRARVWEATYGTPVTDWLDHPAAVSAIAFHPDGRQICTACEDGRARVWSIVPADVDDPERLRWFAERKTGLFLDPERIGDRLGFENWRHR